MRALRIVWPLMVTLLLVSSAVGAQQANSSIAGVVRDTSGAVLPGVSVEAASPALIEKVRTVVTDSEGRYNIVALGPGTYSVTFTLTGFGAFKRDGIELTGGFTATVNADLKVGAVEETVTVSGASPMVDTQGVRQQTIISDELLSTLPTGAKGYTSLARLIPGMNMGSDAGGANGLFMTFISSSWTRHGLGGTRFLFDGMNTQNVQGPGQLTAPMNPSAVEETSVETGGISADSNNSGLSYNMIPKDGSNSFRFGASGSGTVSDLQAENIPDALVARGLTTTKDIIHFYDVHFDVGGPIMRDRLWFFAATRATGVKNRINGLYFNKTVGTPFFTPDLDNPAYRLEWDKSQAARLTWQLSPRNKLGGFFMPQTYQSRGGTQIQAQEASTSFGQWPGGVFQGSWTSPVTSKLLLEAGSSVAITGFPISKAKLADVFGIVIKPTDISITEQSTGLLYNSRQMYFERNRQNRYAERASASYVTGSHAFKAGFQAEHGLVDQLTVINSDQNWIFNRGLPSQIIQWASPYQVRTRFTELGLFAQDRWVIKRLTLNYGVRFDSFRGRTLGEDGTLPTDSNGNPIAAASFIPARVLPAVDDIPNFRDIDPRFGASYDLFGNGRTALKASVGRYVSKASNQIGTSLHPITSSINSVTRVWHDDNSNYNPDCDLKNFTANGECERILNVNFGSANPNAILYADDLISGLGKRDYFWETTAEVQQVVGSHMSVSAGYYRNWSDHFGSQSQGWPTGVNNNLAIGPTDFDPFCVTAPVDPKLPNGGGYQVCGLYDLTPSKVGQGQIRVQRASDFGGKSRASDFITVGVNTRLGRGRELGGSFDTGRTVEDQCFVADSPQQLLNCRIVTPFRGQTQVKVHGSYPLPLGFVVSGVLQNVSGTEFEANWAVPNSLIAPSLGRSLSACGAQVVCSASAVVPLIVPQTQFLPRRTVLDLRGSKIFTIGSRKTRVRANIDVFNALNRSDIVNINSAYGSQWLLPGANSSALLPMLGGRTVQFGFELNF